MRKTVSRPDVTNLPYLPMPVHVRSAGYNEAESGWEELRGARPFVQVFWCVKGSGEFIMPEDNYTIRAGEIFYHLPMEIHQHRSCDASKPWCYYWFTFDGAYAEKFMLSYGYPRKSDPAVDCPVELFAELELLLRRHTAYAQRHAFAIAAEILARIGGMENTDPVESLIRRFITLAEENIGNPGVTVQDLAKKLGVHRMTLNNHFRKEMKISPGKYLDDLRVHHAMQLLRDTSLSQKEICEQSGIANQSYFCRLIREATGFSPGEYRKRAAETGDIQSDNTESKVF